MWNPTPPMPGGPRSRHRRSADRRHTAWRAARRSGEAAANGTRRRRRRSPQPPSRRWPSYVPAFQSYTNTRREEEKTGRREDGKDGKDGKTGRQEDEKAGRREVL